MDDKICRICNTSLPYTMFYKHKTTKDGYRHECKDCVDLKNKRWRENNYEKAKEHWTKANKNPNRKITYQKYKEQNKLYNLINGAKQRAKKLEIPFNLDFDDLEKIMYCPVLNIELDWNANGLQDNSPSIDRIVPEIGYVKGNVRIMSNLANRMKSNATESQLKEFAVWIQNNV